MADILIRGMEIPTEQYGKMVITLYPDGHVVEYVGDMGRVWDAVPLQEGHGRLIDADAVTQEAYRRLLECEKYGNEFEKPYEVIRAIETAKTIVPAEGGTDNG